MRRAFAAAVIFSFLLVGLAAGAATAAEEKLETIHMGFIGPLTGPAAYIGLDALCGAELAAWEVNRQGGFVVGDKKYRLEIVSYDDQMVAAKSVAGLRKLKDKHDIEIAVNNLSGTIMALLEVNEEMGVLLGGFFRHPDATEKGNELVLRHQVPMTEDNRMLAKRAVEHFEPESVAILAGVSDFGRQTAKVYTRVMEELDIEIAAQEWFDQSKETDLRTQLTKIKAADPDLVFVAAYDEGSAAARNQGLELGIDVPYVFTLGMQTKGFELVGEERLEGCARLMQHDMYNPTPRGVANYNRLYKMIAEEEGWPEEPGAYGGNVYEFVWTMILSMEQSGSTMAEKVRETAPDVFPLPEEHNYIGVIGYRENGSGIMDKKFGVFKDGRLVAVE
jgi:branched-chain amino acid transport system substrate-binding protein